jgi:uncharacterized RDD family membrane protein YckC
VSGHLPDIPGSPSHDPLARDASLGRRLGALLYEALLLIAMALVAGFAPLPLASPHVGSERMLSVPDVIARTAMFCILAGGAAWFYAWSWTEGRRTLPQKTWRLALVDARGRAPTRRAALVRYAAAWIGPAAAIAAYAALRPMGHARYAAALLAFNYAWALVDRERRFLHDRIAGTRLVREPTRPSRGH